MTLTTEQANNLKVGSLLSIQGSPLVYVVKQITQTASGQPKWELEIWEDHIEGLETYFTPDHFSAVSLLETEDGMEADEKEGGEAQASPPDTGQKAATKARPASHPARPLKRKPAPGKRK